LLPEKMHKWNLRLDVSSDPLTLIAALEEKMTTYRINPEEIPGLCPKSLRARRHGGSVLAICSPPLGKLSGGNSGFLPTSSYLEVLQGAVELEDYCEWIGKMKDKVHDEPEKFADYILENGQLYRNMGYRAADEDYFPWKLCVPTPHGARVLYECHDSPTAGHLGVRKTITRLSQRYFWPGMYRDAKHHVRHCEACQKFKTVQTKAAGKAKPFTFFLLTS